MTDAPSPTAAPKPDVEPQGVSHQVALSPLADGEEARQLTAAQARLRARMAAPSDAPLVAHERLAALLPDALADFMPLAGPILGPSESAGKPLIGGLRRYRRDRQELLIRVVDAVRAPELFAPVVDELVMQGQGKTGSQRGAVVQGHPAVVREYASGGASAMVIVGERFMIEVRLRGKATEADLSRILGALPLGEFAAVGGNVGSAGQGG